MSGLGHLNCGLLTFLFQTKSNCTLPLGFVDCLHILTAIQIPALCRGESKVGDFSFTLHGAISLIFVIQRSRDKQLGHHIALWPQCKQAGAVPGQQVPKLA